MPILDYYFRDENPSALLFDQASFMKLVTGWYSPRPKRCRAAWASILVVIALGLQTLVPDNNVRLTPTERSQLVNFCMRNAQTVLPELVMRDEDLVGVQVLTALAILFRTSFDLRPAGILIGMAVRLMHRMQLYSKDITQFFTADEMLERSSVFWVVYKLDKGISLKGKSPSTILDADITVHLPPQALPSQDGILWTDDGLRHLNLFRQSVELAHIEGRVYDEIYSSRAAKLDCSEHKRRVARTQEMLSQWYSRIPPDYILENAANNVKGAELVQITRLYEDYLLALLTLHGLWSYQAEWMKKIGSLSRAAIEDIVLALHGPKVGRVSSCLERQTPPGPSGWKYCVNVSRAFMRLFRQTPKTPSLVWQAPPGPARWVDIDSNIGKAAAATSRP